MDGDGAGDAVGVNRESNHQLPKYCNGRVNDGSDLSIVESSSDSSDDEDDDEDANDVYVPCPHNSTQVDAMEDEDQVRRPHQLGVRLCQG